MAINTQKVLLGGVVAGVVLNVIDFVASKYVLGARMIAEMNAFKPGFADAMTQGNGLYIGMGLGFVLGIGLVWTYAGFARASAPARARRFLRRSSSGWYSTSPIINSCCSE